MDYYKILGVEKTASGDEIKRAYRKLSLKYHPDKPNGDSDKFKEINEAYSTLSEPGLRKKYDFKQTHGGGKGFPPGGIPPEFANNAFFANIFRGMGGMGPMGPNVRVYHNGVQVNGNHSFNRIPVIEKVLTISLEEAYEGGSFPLEIERTVNETKELKKVEKETVYVDVKQGIDNNEVIVIQDKGHEDEIGRKGQIRVRVQIKPHGQIKRRGMDLILEKTISLADALCGFEFKFQHLNGKKFTINNKDSTVIQPNFTKRIQGLGMKRGNNQGSLYIVFGIKFPERIDNDKKEMLRAILS
jgi:DnaJ-class molecular chaperone